MTLLHDMVVLLGLLTVELGVPFLKIGLRRLTELPGNIRMAVGSVCIVCRVIVVVMVPWLLVVARGIVMCRCRNLVMAIVSSTGSNPSIAVPVVLILSLNWKR